MQAGDGTRTRDPQLGRLTLYQLSYARTPVSGGGRIRTYVGQSPADLQSAAISHSATPPAPAPHLADPLDSRADGGNRTLNRRFTKPVLCQLSYVSKTGRNEQTRMIDGELRNVNGRERGNRRDWGKWAGAPETRGG